MKSFGGKVLFLDRGDINTDEIIPAKYLTEISKSALKPYCFEDLKLGSFDSKQDLQDKGVVITRANFGCGSSREHAPWALEANGIRVVIAQSFARIFRQNMFNCGMLAIELAPDSLEEIFQAYQGKETNLLVDLNSMSFQIECEGKKGKYTFKIAQFDEALVKAGGWVEYADAKY